VTLSTWKFGKLPLFGFDVIVADPPWDFQNYSAKGTKKGADPHYRVMPIEAIAALRRRLSATRLLGPSLGDRLHVATSAGCVGRMGRDL